MARREYPTVLELVGHTPIVRLARLSRDVPGELLAKLEYLNPGGSVKDRIGLAMVEAAEQNGRLRPGGTIVEPTSGNTGVGLAMAAALRGYRCIFVMPDKMSQEKISMLRAYGAEVVITPTAVDPHSPESYYAVSDRLAEEIPGGFKPDQYSNPANPEAHYETTGPELWEQTEGGDVDAIVISVGTGGTITGVGRYFKEHGSRARLTADCCSGIESPPRVAFQAPVQQGTDDSRRRGRQDAQAPGHPEVQDQRAGVGLEQQILRAPSRAPDRAAGQRLDARDIHGPAQTFVTHPQFCNAASHNVGFDATAGRFDFR